MEKVSFLKKMPVFEGLDDKQIEIILGGMGTKEFAEGKVVIQEGEEGDEMYIIYEGMVEVSRSLTLPTEEAHSSLAEKALSRLSAEDYAFFGEIGLLERSRRTATVTTLTPCRFMVITAGNFKKIGKDYPEIGYQVITNIARVLCSRLRKANENVLKLTTALSVIISR